MTAVQMLNIVFAVTTIAGIVGLLVWSIRADKLDRLA